MLFGFVFLFLWKYLSDCLVGDCVDASLGIHAGAPKRGGDGGKRDLVWTPVALAIGKQSWEKLRWTVNRLMGLKFFCYTNKRLPLAVLLLFTVQKNLFCSVTCVHSNGFAMCKHLIECDRAVPKYFLLPLKLIYVKTFFANWFASFSHCQHLILEYKTSLKCTTTNISS